MQLVLAYIFSILILYGNVIYRPIMSLTTGNVIKHSVQYLNHEVDIMLIVMNHFQKVCKLSNQSNRINQNCKTLILLFI